MMKHKDFAQRFKELRLKRDLSQNQLAQLFDMSRSNISKYEAGIQLPEYSQLTKICDYFGVSRSYMLGDEITLGELLDERINDFNMKDIKNLSDDDKEKLVDKLVDIIKIMNK